MPSQSTMEYQQRPKQPPLPTSARALSWRTLWRDPWWRASLVVGGLVLVVGSSLLWWFYHSETERIVLHYTTLFGIDWLGYWWWLYVPVVGTLLLTVGHGLAVRFAPNLFSVVQWRMVAVTQLLLWAICAAGLILLLLFNRSFS